MITDEKRIDEVLSRGVSEIIGVEELRAKMVKGEQLRVKFGIDPTSPNVHVGRSVPLLKLRDFQELGHHIILIIGDATGVIGDTSDKTSERPMIEKEVIEANKQEYFGQIAKILDMSNVEFRYNSEWLDELGYRDIGEYANMFSVADFIARDNIKKRLDEGKRVSLREVLYPLMQGYDSVAVRADLEIGGTDQRFNCLAGRTMQPHFGQQAQAVMLGPIINGTDGTKMSSSKGNVIALTMSPAEMYGKVMSMHDDDLITYFTVCTRVSLEEITNISHDLSQGLNPRDIKMRLAHEMVTMYHGAEHARAAQDVFVVTFQKGGVPHEMEEICAPYTESLVSANIVASKSELKRLLQEGGIRNATTGEKLQELPESVDTPVILKVGKRRFVKLI